MRSNKRSGTKLSPYEKQLKEFTFFLDRNLGTKRVAEAMRKAGANIEVHADHFSPEGSDEEWLSACGMRGWIALTLDYRIRYRVTELQALHRHKVKAFLIARAGQLNGEMLCQLLVGRLPKFVALTLQTPAPFAYRVTPTGVITRLPLKHL